MIEVYADGSSYQGIGSWAFCVVKDDELMVHHFDSFEDATNNRAELLAVINFFETIPLRASDNVTIISDSAYVINCFLDKWYVRWRQQNWYGSAGKVKNRDLWERLLSLVESVPYPITWKHVRGHQGNKWNDYVDQLCTKCRLNHQSRV